MDKKKCKKQVWNNWNPCQCSRNAAKDGYCKQHHHDSVKARREKSDRQHEEDYYQKSKGYAFNFVEEATDEDLKKLLEKINKKIRK